MQVGSEMGSHTCFAEERQGVVANAGIQVHHCFSTTCQLARALPLTGVA